jgi:hypothetical protein
MRAKQWTIVIAVAASLYMAFALWQAIAFIRSGFLLGALLGVALLVIPLLGLWLVWRELRFAAAVQHLADELATRNQLPPELERRPSGRPTVAAATAEFTRCQEEIQQNPRDPAAWYALALAYDAGGDRKRARAAMAHALALYEGDSDHPLPPILSDD